MTKRDIVIRISKETGISQENVGKLVQKTLDHIVEDLANGHHIELRDFGVFDVVIRKARIGRNPKKPTDVVQIPERKVVKFKPGREMKLKVV